MAATRHTSLREPFTVTSKTETMSAIMQINATARPEFLSEFSNQQLCAYWQRLREARERRAPWDSLALAQEAPWSTSSGTHRRAS